MARRHEAVEWLKKGYPPSKIAENMDVTVATVMNYLYNQVGEGKIRRSDLVFSIDQDTRDTIEQVISQLGITDWFEIHRAIKRTGKPLNPDDLRIYIELRDARVAFGDMYEIIREVEVKLHDTIKNTLISEYGPHDWWRKGIPENIRAECAAALEKDSDPASEPYCYTNFIHLKEIFDKKWSIFSKVLPENLISNKKKLMSDLGTLNQIRNYVMHPVKGTIITDKEFSFTREFKDYLDLDQWLELDELEEFEEW